MPIDLEAPIAPSLYATARGYTKMLDIGHQQTPETPGVTANFLMPKSLLAGFALELYFKAWLRFDGFTGAQLKGLGHNLTKAFERCVKRGLRDGYREVVSRFAERHLDLGYRYMDPNGQYNHPNFEAVIKLLWLLDEEVYRHIDINGYVEANNLRKLYSSSQSPS
jgi:hypothetical protein